jgi:hypothetical protein
VITFAEKTLTEMPASESKSLPLRTNPWTTNRTHAQNRFTFSVVESHITGTYANLCRVTVTPEEIIVDFGLNKQVAGPAPETIQLTQRIIVNFITAKLTGVRS